MFAIVLNSLDDLLLTEYSEIGVSLQLTLIALLPIPIYLKSQKMFGTTRTRISSHPRMPQMGLILRDKSLTLRHVMVSREPFFGQQ